MNIITKNLLALCAVFLLIGCSSREEIDKKTQEEYMALSCNQLNDKHNFLNEDLKKTQEQKDTMDGVKTAINALAIISILGGGGGSTCDNGISADDIHIADCKRKLEILHKVMLEKKCDSCSVQYNSNKLKPEDAVNKSAISSNVAVDNKDSKKKSEKI